MAYEPNDGSSFLALCWLVLVKTDVKLHDKRRRCGIRQVTQTIQSTRDLSWLVLQNNHVTSRSLMEDTKPAGFPTASSNLPFFLTSQLLDPLAI